MRVTESEREDAPDASTKADDAASAHRDGLLEYARRVLKDRHEAEDVAQESLLRTSAAPRGVSIGRWLRAVCYRLAVDRLRRRSREARAIAELPRGRVEPNASESFVRESEARRIRACVLELEEPYRSALTLRYLEDLSFPEVASRLGTIERTARTWVGRGLVKLRAKLGETP